MAATPSEPGASAAPPPFDAGRAAVYAIGVGVPVAACLHYGGPAVALFAGVGAMNALITDPRRRVAARLVSIACAMAAVLAAAAAGDVLRPHPDLALALAVLLAYPAGLVPPVFPYVSMVAKLLPLAVIVVATGVFPSGHVLAGFAIGTLFATAATLVEGWLRRIPPNADPMHELVALWHGHRNPVAYAVAFTGATALALVAALALSAAHPMWAVVATLVLFDVGMLAQGGDHALVLARLWDTLIGCAAVAVAALALRLWRRGHPPPPGAPDGPDPVEPAHAGVVEPAGHL